MVWEATLEPTEKFIMAYFADRAGDAGDHVWPAASKIARCTGLSERTVHRGIKKLLAKGLIVVTGRTQYRTNNYRINLEALARIAIGDTVSPIEDEKPGRRVSQSHPEGVTVSPTKVSESHPIGDTVTPKPSLNHPLNPQGILPPAPTTPKTGSPLIYDMEKALAEVTGMDHMLNKGDLNRIATQLFKRDYRADQIRKLYGPEGVWYSDDWRGKQGQCPDLSAIKKTIAGFASGIYQKSVMAASARNGHAPPGEPIPEEPPDELAIRKAAWRAAKPKERNANGNVSTGTGQD